MALKPCLACGSLTARGSYCARHQRVGWYDRPSPSSRNRLSKQERDTLKALAGHRCQRCGTAATPQNPLIVHHKRRVADGGGHARSNLEVLCMACSLAEHGGKDYRR